MFASNIVGSLYDPYVVTLRTGASGGSPQRAGHVRGRRGRRTARRSRSRGQGDRDRGSRGRRRRSRARPTTTRRPPGIPVQPATGKRAATSGLRESGSAGRSSPPSLDEVGALGEQAQGELRRRTRSRPSLTASSSRQPRRVDVRRISRPSFTYRRQPDDLRNRRTARSRPGRPAPPRTRPEAPSTHA